jgi:hypothetical protein
MVNIFTEEGDLKGRKMASTHFGSNCPPRVKFQKFYQLKMTIQYKSLSSDASSTQKLNAHIHFQVSYITYLGGTILLLLHLYKMRHVDVIQLHKFTMGHVLMIYQKHDIRE